MRFLQLADAFDISIEDLKGPSRRREISWARQWYVPDATAHGS